MKKVLLIMFALLFSTGQTNAVLGIASPPVIEARQNNNIQLPLDKSDQSLEKILNISNTLDRFNLNKTTKTRILSAINEMSNEDKCKIYCILSEFPVNESTKSLLPTINRSDLYDFYETYTLHAVLNKLPKAWKTEDILKNIGKMRDGDTLVNLYCVIDKLYHILIKLRKLPDIEKIKEIVTNISKMNRECYTLYYLYDVLDELPLGKITTDILLTISKINSANKLYYLRNTLEKLQEVEITEDILFNIININNEAKLKYLYYVLYELPDKLKTEEILLNISKINDVYTMNLIYDVLNLVPKKITKETLLKIIKCISKINDIDKLRETALLFSNLTKNMEQEDAFFEISENIRKMDGYKLYILSKVLDILPESVITEDILFDITDMTKNELVLLYLVFYYLPEEGKTEKILFNISEMSSDELKYLTNVLDNLPKEGKTTEILANISMMDQNTVFALYKILDILPKEGKTKTILFNISKINSKDTLHKLYKVLEKAKNDDEKMQVLREFGVIPKKQNV